MVDGALKELLPPPMTGGNQILPWIFVTGPPLGWVGTTEYSL